MEPRAGFEPATSALPSVRTSSGFLPSPATETINVDEVLREYKKFLEIDLHRSFRTIQKHMRYIGRFLKQVKNPYVATSSDVRSFLQSLEGNGVDGAIKALRVFFRDFLNREDVIRTFKVPQSNIKPKTVPAKEELQKFFRALPSLKQKVLFLLYATTGLRRDEVYFLRKENVDLEKRMIIPDRQTATKRTWVTFFNEEAKQFLAEYLKNVKGEYLFASKYNPNANHKIFHRTVRKTGIRITPQILREWFANEMARLGVPDRYVDAFCGRVPRSVLARHYTDFSPERLKEIYDKANLKVLE